MKLWIAIAWLVASGIFAALVFAFPQRVAAMMQRVAAMMKPLSQIISVVLMIFGGFSFVGGIVAVFSGDGKEIFWLLWVGVAVGIFVAGRKLLAWGRS